MISQMSLIRTHTVPFHLQCLNLSVVKFIETDSRVVVSRGWGRWEGVGSHLMGMDLQFCKTKEL